MGIFNQSIKSRTINRINNSISDDLMRLLNIDPNTINKNKLSEITYFTCLKLLSESIAVLPLKMYQESNQAINKASDHSLYNLLKTRPNPYMSSFNFWASVELNRNQHGNSFVYVDTDRGKVKGLYILPSDRVTIWVDDAGIISKDNAIWYIYKDKNEKEMKINHRQIMHFRTSMSFDGITGMSVQDVLATSIENSQASQQFINNYWRNGMMAKGLLQYTGDISDDSRNMMRTKFESMSSGIKNAGRILPVPIGFSFSTIETKLIDGQFLELSKYNALQIAAAFGIKSHQLNEQAKFNNYEQAMKEFYTSTLLAILTQYEQELSAKLLTQREREQGYYFKFNVDVIMRGEFESRIKALSEGVKNFIYTPNEARAKEELTPLEGGDKLYANGNVIPLDMAGQQYVKDVEGGESE